MEIHIDARGASLAEAAAFWRGFTPASGSAHERGDQLVLAFRRDGDFAPAAVVLQQRGDVIVGRATSGGIERQLARMLSLDVDPTPWNEVLARDPAIAALQARWPDFRPVCFPSPWEAAAWGVLVKGIGMQRASRLKAKLAAEHGERAEIDGVSIALLPSPQTIAAADALPGLDAERFKRLRAVAEFALAGKLEADRLRAMPTLAALTELRAIRGVGEWTASHVLLRGAALADGEPFGEPRVRRGIARAYGLEATPTETQSRAIAERWRPYRMWGAILVVRALAGTEGWHGPEKRGSSSRGRRSRSIKAR